MSRADELRYNYTGLDNILSQILAYKRKTKWFISFSKCNQAKCHAIRIDTQQYWAPLSLQINSKSHRLHSADNLIHSNSGTASFKLQLILTLTFQHIVTFDLLEKDP